MFNGKRVKKLEEVISKLFTKIETLEKDLNYLHREINGHKGYIEDYPGYQFRAPEEGLKKKTNKMRAILNEVVDYVYKEQK